MQYSEENVAGFWQNQRAAIFNRIKQHLNEHVLVNARLYGMAKSERLRRRQKG